MFIADGAACPGASVNPVGRGGCLVSPVVLLFATGASGRVLCPAVLSECSLSSLGDSGVLSFGLVDVLLVEVLLVDDLVLEVLVEVLLVGWFCGSSLPQAATRVMLAQAMMAAARLIGVTVGAFLGWLILGLYYFLM